MAGEGPENVLEAVRARAGELSRAERRVAELVLADPRAVLSATVAETARRAEVSQPTVIRFAVALGCEGFQDFKLRLAHSLALGSSATHSVLEPGEPVKAVAGKVFDYTLASLDWARRRLDPAAVAAAVGLLAGARTITFAGFGASAIVALDGAQKFPLFGVPCRAAIDVHEQVMAAAMMEPGDVLVAVSHTGLARPLLDMVETARRAGAAVIALTGGATPLAHLSDVALVVETLDNTDLHTPTISRIAALVAVDVLSTAVALQAGPERRERLAAMKRRLAAVRAGR